MSQHSISENNGISLLTEKDEKIYSVGISTGGNAETKMAQRFPQFKIIATTIDPIGAEFAKQQIAEGGLSEQIEVKIENVVDPLPYPDDYFDYIYARLVLHYLTKLDLQLALRELYRVLKREGKLFIVVRSIDCPEAKGGHFDPETCLTSYRSHGKTYARYFHSEMSIRENLMKASFSIQHIQSYPEQLCIDFHRLIPAGQIDILIEVLASKV